MRTAWGILLVLIGTAAGAQDSAAVTRLIEAQNKLAVLMYLDSLDFHVIPPVAQELLEEQKTALFELSAAQDGPLAEVERYLLDVKKVTSEMNEEAVKIVANYAQKYLKDGAQFGQKMNGLEMLDAAKEKRNGVLALRQARQWESLLKASVGDGSRRGLLISDLTSTYAGARGKAVREVDAMVKALVDIEKRRETLRVEAEELKLFLKGVETVEAAQDPKAWALGKLDEVAAKALAGELDEETAKYLSGILGACREEILNACEKLEKIGMSTEVDIPDSVKTTAKGMAVLSAVFRTASKTMKVPGTGAVMTPLGDLIDLYATALDTVWTAAEAMARIIARRHQGFQGWYGLGVWKKILEEQGEIVQDDDAAKYGVKIAITVEKVKDQPKGVFLALSDQEYAAISLEGRDRLVRALCDERLVNAWHDATAGLWNAILRQGSNVSMLELSNLSQRLADPDFSDGKASEHWQERIKLYARKTGMEPESQLAFARSGQAEIAVRGKKRKVTLEALAEMRDGVLADLGRTEFIREELGTVDAEGREAYLAFMRAVRAAGMAFSRPQLQRMFNGFVKTGADVQRLIRTLRKVREDRLYAGLTLSIPFVSAGPRDELRRGASTPVVADVIADGLAPGFEAPGTLTWALPEWASRPEPLAVRLKNGRNSFTLQLQVPPAAPQGDYVLTPRIEVALPTGRTESADRASPVSVIEEPVGPAGLQSQWWNGETRVLFHSRALEENESAFRLYTAGSPDGPWTLAHQLRNSSLDPIDPNAEYGRIAPGTAAILDNRGAYSGKRSGPSYYKVAQVLIRKDGTEFEAASDILAPSKPVIAVSTEDQGTKRVEEVAEAGSYKFTLWFRASLPDQSTIYPEVHFTIRWNNREWHAWQPANLRWWASYRLPSLIGTFPLSIEARAPDGTTCIRKLAVRYAPDNAGELLRAAMRSPDEIVPPELLEELRKAPGEVAQLQQELAKNCSKGRAPLDDPKYSADFKVDYFLAWNRPRARISYLTRDLPELIEQAKWAALGGQQNNFISACLWDLAVQRWSQYLEQLPAIRQRAFERLERNGEFEKEHHFVFGEPNPRDLAGFTESQERKKKEELERWEWEFAGDLRSGMEIGAHAGDYPAVVSFAAALLGINPSVSTRGVVECELAEAMATLAGEREQAAALWMRGVIDQTSTSRDPADSLKIELSKARPAWWPPGKADPEPSPPPDPAALSAMAPNAPGVPALNPKPPASPPPSLPPAAPTLPTPPQTAAPAAPRAPPQPEETRRAEGSRTVEPSFRESREPKREDDLFAEAERLAQAREAAQNPYGACLWRAGEHAARGDYDRAIAEYQESLKREPGPFDPPVESTRYNLAELLALKGRLDEADLEIRRLEALQDRNPWTPTLRGEFHLKKGDRASAAKSFAEAMNRDPKQLANVYDHAGRMCDGRQFPRALLLYDACELMEPRGGALHFGRAQAFAGLGDKERAIRSYRRYLEFDAASVWAEKARRAIAELER